MISLRLHWRIPTEGHSVPSMMYFPSWITPGAKTFKTDLTDGPNSILYISLLVYRNSVDWNRINLNNGVFTFVWPDCFTGIWIENHKPVYLANFKSPKDPTVCYQVCYGSGEPLFLNTPSNHTFVIILHKCWCNHNKLKAPLRSYMETVQRFCEFCHNSASFSSQKRPPTRLRPFN